VAAAGYLLLRMGSVLWSAHAVDPARGKPAVEQLVVRQTAVDENPQLARFGSTRAVGKTLFQDYLFPFEAISLVLLVAVVGALAVARPHHEKHDGDAPEQSS
jgi:NADH-ubiquinone/plastoquinone oxidoreductase subunit 6